MRLRLYSLISIPLFGLLYSFTALIVLSIFILHVLKLKSAIPAVCQFWARGIFILIGKKFHVLGREKIEKDKRYILIANHSSLFDIMAIMSFYPNVSWFGREGLLKVPLFGKILKIIKYVPFKAPTVKNTKEMLEKLTLNSLSQTVAIFPEGTRTLDGRINHFYKGFIYLFRTSDLGILPVTLNGFYKLKPKNRSYINFSTKLEVIIHNPISRESLLEKNDSEIIAKVKSVIESAYI